MTTSSIALQDFIPGSSRKPRNARTLLLQMAMEEERAREVGARLKALRGPKPQPVVAQEVGVTLRAYQRWEAGGGLAWENLQAVARVFGVSENYILYGEETVKGPESRLDRLEEKVDALYNRLGRLLDEMERDQP